MDALWSRSSKSWVASWNNQEIFKKSYNENKNFFSSYRYIVENSVQVRIIFPRNGGERKFQSWSKMLKFLMNHYHAEAVVKELDVRNQQWQEAIMDWTDVKVQNLTMAFPLKSRHVGDVANVLSAMYCKLRSLGMPLTGCTQTVRGNSRAVN